MSDINNRISESILDEILCRVYFKDATRTPNVGYFVEFNQDSNSLESKGMVRFVPLSSWDRFNETSDISLSKILVINTLHSVTHQKS